MSGSIREKCRSSRTFRAGFLSANMLGRTYVKRQTDTRIVVLTYDFRSAFANPTPGVFPSAELLEVFLLLFLLRSFCTRHHTAGKIPVAGTFSSRQEAADEIRKSESRLYFIRPTAICEFNQVAASLDALKSELSASLKEQWHMQQQRRRQFSALAHDIKTPLTIVRGNAELLSETALDPTQQTCNRFILEMPRRSRTICRELSSSQRRMIPLHVPQSAVFRRSFTRHRFSTICSNIKPRSEKRTACSFFHRDSSSRSATVGTSAAAYFKQSARQCRVLLTAQRNGHFRCLHPRL